MTLQSGELKSQVDFTGLKPRRWRGCDPSESSRGEFVSLPFPHSGGCLHVLAPDPISHIKRTLFHPLGSVLMSPSPLLTLLSPSQKDACGYNGPTRIISHLRFISLQSPFCHPGSHSHVPGVRMWASLERGVT